MLKEYKFKEIMKEKIFKKIKLTTTNVIFYMVILYTGVSYIQQEFRINEYDTQIKEYEQKIETQKEILNELKKEIKEKNTYDVMEELARKQGYIKPSEKIYVDIND